MYAGRYARRKVCMNGAMATSWVPAYAKPRLRSHSPGAETERRRTGHEGSAWAAIWPEGRDWLPRKWTRKQRPLADRGCPDFSNTIRRRVYYTSSLANATGAQVQKGRKNTNNARVDVVLRSQTSFNIKCMSLLGAATGTIQLVHLILGLDQALRLLSQRLEDLVELTGAELGRR